MRVFLIILIMVCVTGCSTTRLAADREFRPPIQKPTFPQGNGPVVMIDAAHFNWHTANGRYRPFAELLRRDGYVVESSQSPFSEDVLRQGKILVIANALNERNKNDWSPPNPSAFTDEEIRAVRDWVREGGSLLLIADHSPFPAAADKLASAFGVHFNNGFALDEKTLSGDILFSRSNGTLADNPITNGRSAKERVDRVETFTGSAFRVDKSKRVEPLLVFGPNIVSFSPTNSEEIKSDTPRIKVTGWYQGAAMRVGKGRVAVFGEAAMFTAQVEGRNRVPFGMNAPMAKQNPQFILNVLHWLSGLLDK